jgi:phosphoribosylformimino-5-aminoimidazole carboxamide ribotide isomerase
MEIYPAIDLMQGQCVRLSGGDFDARTNYAEPPAAVAQGYAAAGAKWLHVVDLDGARDPKARQKSVIAAIAKASSLKMQTGGGVRSAEDVRELLALGASRVIVGSLCVKDPAAVKAMLKEHGAEKIVLALDVRGDFDKGFFVTTAGWKDTSAVAIEDMLAQYRGLARHILCTDISKDGKLAGPNTELYRRLAAAAPDMKIQASGGVSALADLDGLKASGAAGVVIGKALYEKKFTLVEALGKAA